ncbi:S-layer homology domain-containing protein [Ureibacillus sp. BA0131]|uniref:S-layer homology domain-containing protein n=1 Tax=Ureibacillus aquaedulcis TaxID=3058421 RepID=A0ABT8GKX7_9BACL|nr:S-layer homology domain-containing protein [Ureibacillus sp. BA0131]MDN4492073.1 S-layer homology domain-containing protein [Ureibacillus sp. BA0131]
MNKKYTAFLAALAATAVISVPAADANSLDFSDLSKANIHYEAIQSLATRGVLNGFPDGTFKPNQLLTREQAAIILTKVLKIDASGYTKQVFSDVDSTSPYFREINALYERGIIRGYQDQTFKPGNSLTRAEMASILVNAFDIRISSSITYPFKDIGASSWSRSYIQALYDARVTTGTSKTTFSPNEPVKRDQMASFVVRAEAYNQAPAAENDFAEQVVEYTNIERAKNGLQPLEIYQPVMNSAQIKSDDMSKNSYFSHNSPTYGTPFELMTSLGISYRAAGENIAKGQRTAQEVVEAWMNSEGHRANILNANFTHIGVGYAQDGNYWTQQFIRP